MRVCVLLQPFDSALAAQIEILWADPGLKATFALRSKFQLDDACAYFFSHAKDLAQANFVPSYEDVLRCRARTTVRRSAQQTSLSDPDQPTKSRSVLRALNRTAAATHTHAHRLTVSTRRTAKLRFVFEAKAETESGLTCVKKYCADS